MSVGRTERKTLDAVNKLFIEWGNVLAETKYTGESKKKKVAGSSEPDNKDTERVLRELDNYLPDLFKDLNHEMITRILNCLNKQYYKWMKVKIDNFEYCGEDSVYPVRRIEKTNQGVVLNLNADDKPSVYHHVFAKLDKNEIRRKIAHHVEYASSCDQSHQVEHGDPEDEF
jgi:hypothetical protein